MLHVLIMLCCKKPDQEPTILQVLCPAWSGALARGVLWGVARGEWPAGCSGGVARGSGQGGYQGDWSANRLYLLLQLLGVVVHSGTGGLLDN